MSTLAQRFGRRYLTLGVFLGLGMFQSSQASESFDQYCARCHGDEIAAIPSHAQLLDVAKRTKPQQMVERILNGKLDLHAQQDSSGVLKAMPPHDYLANEDIADIVNGIREEADAAGTVSVAEVARIRGTSSPLPVPLTAEEYQRADALYHERCAGCHAVDRSGRAGSPLYRWAMENMGGPVIKEIIHHGSDFGMPGIDEGTSLSGADLSLLARYLQEPARALPRFEHSDVLRSWRHEKASPSVAKRAHRIRDLFVSVLHDNGQVLLIDGPRREIVGAIDVMVAPHRVIRSADGRYLYVMSRSAEVALVDLRKGGSVRAHVKAGYEGRSLALSESGDALAIGSYWPPQVVLVDKENLEPKQTIVLDEGAYERNRTAAEVAQVVALEGKDEFLIVTKAQGNLITLSDRNGLEARIAGSPFLRAGSFAADGRHFLVPSDNGDLVVYDSQRQTISSLVRTGMLGGAEGVALRAEAGGGRWINVGVDGAPIVALETGPSDSIWRLQTHRPDQHGGSISIVSHPVSEHVWIDYPLNRSRRMSGVVGVLNKADLAKPPTLLPILEWAGLDGEAYARAIHPQFNRDGSEVWVTIWNRRDRSSAIVIVDDQTLEPLHVIKDARLSSSIGTYAVSQARSAE